MYEPHYYFCLLLLRPLKLFSWSDLPAEEVGGQGCQLLGGQELHEQHSAGAHIHTLVYTMIAKKIVTSMGPGILSY